MSAFELNAVLSHIINHDGTAVDAASLAGKTIGFYFSAHWCGPCRNFTPKLAERYQKLMEEGENLEIIFVSADETDEEAMDYFKSMPWKMLNFEQRDLETQLSRTFQVRGIPSLVLVEADGTLITTEGREVLMNVAPSKAKEYAAEKAEKERRRAEEMVALKANFNVINYFADKKVVDSEGNFIAADHLKGKIVGLYFSAHWCPPCRGFTPILAEKYKTFVGDNKPFEIIFISSDRDESSAKEYFGEMPWKMLDFTDRDSKLALGELFEVSGIPTLVLVYEDGTFTDEGTEAITSIESFEKLSTFVADKKAEIEKLNAEIANYPETITIPEHEHPLKKLPKVYGGHYGCDECGSGGQGWVYHCDECGFDMHPKCAMKSFNKGE